MTTKRTATGCRGIYFNERTGKYDVKYNYTEVSDDRTAYRQKWSYGLETMSDARREMRRLQNGKTGIEKEGGVTLSDAYDLWESKAVAQNLSPITIINTRDQFKMITRVIPPETIVSDITEDAYYEFVAGCRRLGYGEETISLLNGSFRKLINLCYKRRLIQDNVLDHCDNVRVVRKSDYRVIPKEEHDLIDAYFENLGEAGHAPLYRFLYSVLYYTGMRIGEALALTYDDFRPYVYHGPDGEEMRMKVSVTKSYATRIRTIKEPKNFKSRLIPLASHPMELYEALRDAHLQAGGSVTDRICPITYSPIDKTLKKACRELGLPAYHLHEFRHSYISYLISRNIPITVIEKVSGDTQNTILTRYSHCFGDGDSMIMDAMESM